MLPPVFIYFYMGSSTTFNSALIVLRALYASLLRMSACSQVVQPDTWECCVALSHSMTSSFCPDEARLQTSLTIQQIMPLGQKDKGVRQQLHSYHWSLYSSGHLFTLKASHTHTLTCKLAGKSHRSTNNKVSLLLTLACA